MTLTRRDWLAHVAAALPLASAAWPRRATGAPPARATGRPRPTAAQLAWQRDELAVFVHFGVNTFTDREWGDGRESPAIFAPTALDCRQWVAAAKAAGARALVLTAKHHDGFCLWPSDTTTHSVAASPFRGGRGDVVREFTDACRAGGVRAGLYLSPWDRNHPAYGDTDAYNAIYRAQLTELLTRYGPIHEVWFDGANGEGPNGKRQVYDWPATWNLVRQLQPDAVMFSDAGPDVRWIGNERGVAGETNWSTVDPATVPVPGLDGDAVIRSLREGDRDGTVWRPGETDVSIRPGWFWHPAEDAAVRTPEDLEALWFTSVGRNSKLLLNVPPTREGRFHATDVAHLEAFGRRVSTRFARPVTADARAKWRTTGDASATLDLALRRPATIETLDLRERIEEGQRVAAFRVSGRVAGAWRPLLEGTTIGCRRAARIAPIVADALRLEITDAVEPPLPVALAGFRG
ncbi:MAG: alpha-L-fucosidase [Gemmatimonadota bacterium]